MSIGEGRRVEKSAFPGHQVIPNVYLGTEQHNHTKHHENVPQGDKNPEVAQAEQKLPDIVPCSRLCGIIAKSLGVFFL